MIKTIDIEAVLWCLTGDVVNIIKRFAGLTNVTGFLIRGAPGEISYREACDVVKYCRVGEDFECVTRSNWCINRDSCDGNVSHGKFCLLGYPEKDTWLGDLFLNMITADY